MLEKRRALLTVWADFCASANPAAAAPVELVMPLVVSPAAKREAGRNFMRELLNRGRRGGGGAEPLRGLVGLPKFELVVG